MLCGKCKKREATVHYKEVLNGQVTEYALCEVCAQEVAPLKVPFSLGFSDFLPGFFRSNTVEKRCPDCGMTLHAFSKGGRFGCASCYSAFGDSILPVVKQMQGNSRHVGKIPERAGKKLRTQSRLEELQEKLEQAVKAQEFEQAAKWRDAIRELKGGEPS